MPRDDAYKAVQENAMAAWESETSFRDSVARDARITKYLNRPNWSIPSTCSANCGMWNNLFERVFGAHPAGEKGIANKA